MGADLETAYRRVNELLVSAQPDAPLVTACIALLEPECHRIRMLSAGQAPILHVDAADQRCLRHGPNGLPLGAMADAVLRPMVELTLAPGDWFVLLSDGIYECPAPGGELFGRPRVEQLLLAGARDTPAKLAERLLAETARFRGHGAQDDDITMVLVKRQGGA
jgi:sigma-B regulation protein RsbU (phosphoserine phosphatase)